jgi:hypothetical protein
MNGKNGSKSFLNTKHRIQNTSLQVFFTMFRSLDRHASKEGAPASVRNTNSTPVPVNNSIDWKISELERSLVSRTIIIDKAKALSKSGRTSLIETSKQEKVSYLIF